MGNKSNLDRTYYFCIIEMLMKGEHDLVPLSRNFQKTELDALSSVQNSKRLYSLLNFWREKNFGEPRHRWTFVSFWSMLSKRHSSPKTTEVISGT